MNEVVIVKLWGVIVGAIGYEPGQTEVATFEYNEKFTNMGVEISPLKVPASSLNYSFDEISKKTFHGLPGFIADALPDKFGNQLIDQYFASKGKTLDDITSLDRLLYVGNRAMGALEFEPSENMQAYNSGTQLNLNDLSKLAEILLSNKEDFANELKHSDKETAINLLRIGSSAGGARSKALVAIDNEGKIFDGTANHNFDCKYYLLKFDSDSNSDREKKDPKGITKVEYIYSIIARNCGIDMPKTGYIKTEDDFHFLIERFDRIKKSDNDTKMDKLHYVSWCGMAHADRETTGAYSYEQLVLTARELGLGQDSITELFRRAIFNIVGRNQDDHTKNFGFIMDKEARWSLSPAFDMTYSFDPKGKWTRVHQINLNGKQDNFSYTDIVDFGKVCNLKESKVKKILDKTILSFKDFEKLAEKFNLEKDLRSTVISNLRRKIV